MNERFHIDKEGGKYKVTAAGQSKTFGTHKEATR